MLKFEQHLTLPADDLKLIEVLNLACSEHSLSNGQIKAAINKGALWLTRGKYTQRIRKLKKALKTDDTLHFYYDENVLNQQPAQAKLIADCHDYSVWYKPYGMLSQGSKWSDHCTIARWAETQLMPQRSAFIVHRLDRAASGLIIIAHSKKMAQAFSQIFEHHQLEKHYQIIVHGELISDSDTTKDKVVLTDIDGKSAKSTFQSVETNTLNDLSLLAVKIETGRKHQIRKHAASIGLPVVGDRLHGNNKMVLPDEINLQLCAVKLAFNCPVTKQEQSFTLPNELKPNLKHLAALLQ